MVGQFFVTNRHNFHVPSQFCCVCCLSRTFSHQDFETRYTAICQGTHGFGNVIRMAVYGTRDCVNSLAPVGKVWPSLRRCSLNSEMPNSIMCSLLVPISTHTGIALLFRDRGTRRGLRGQQHAPAALYPRERPCTHFTGGWVGPRTGLDGRKISSPPEFDPGSSSP